MLLDGTGIDSGYGITVDTSGNMYMTGYYTSSATVQINNLALNSTPVSSGYTFPATSGASASAFVLKYNSGGTLTGSMILDGNGPDAGYGITTDTSGNMYVTAYYNSTATTQINNLALSSTPVSSGYTFPAASTFAAFVLKYNSVGTLVGSMLLDGTGVDFGAGITTDTSGNMYVTGFYNSTTTVQINNLFLSSTPVSSGYTLPAASTQVMFVLKYNSVGTLVGSMILDGTGGDAGNGITTDTSGNMYVTGQYNSTATTQINNLALSSTPVRSGYTFPAASTFAAFVLKYNSGGTLTGSMVFDGTNSDIGYGITTDSFGNMYVTGQYNSTATTQINNLALSSTPVASGYTFPAASTGAAFIIKYGNVQNIQLTLPNPRLQTFSGSMNLDGTGNDFGYGITTDSSGNMYVTGQYISTATTQINNLALNSTPVSSGFTFPAASTQAAFVLKYNSSGTLLGSMILDGTSNDLGYGITVDTSGNIYVTGYYNSTATTQINNLTLSSTPVSSGFTFPASSQLAAFVLKYNSGGTLLGSMLLDGTIGDIGYGITTDSSGNMYVTGSYNSTATTQINNLALSSTPVSSGFTLPATSTNGSAFVLKYNSGGTLTGSMILDGTNNDVGYSITTDSSGNMYMTGYYTSSATTQINNLALNSTPVSSGFTFPAASTSAAFVLKYNSRGTLVGSMLFDGSASEYGYGITTDTSGNMYVTGQYGSGATTQINNLALSSTPVSSGYTFPGSAAPGGSGFVLKYNSGGTLLGSMILTGTIITFGYGITTDSSGNMYVTGNYNSGATTQINNLALSSTPVSSGFTLPATFSFNPAVFVLKYNTSGTLVGSMILDGTGNDIGYGITVDTSGNMYVTGQYISTATVQINNLALNSTPVSSGYTFPATSGASAFVLKYSFADTTLIQKNIYLQSPGNYYTINKGPSFLTVGPTSNVISADWTLDRWQYSIA
jgi:ABC-type uncharacterized transport system permease subunit